MNDTQENNNPHCLKQRRARAKKKRRIRRSYTAPNRNAETCFSALALMIPLLAIRFDFSRLFNLHFSRVLGPDRMTERECQKEMASPLHFTFSNLIARAHFHCTAKCLPISNASDGCSHVAISTNISCCWLSDYLVVCVFIILFPF